MAKEQPKSGFAFHVHHNQLVELCTDYDERVRYIKATKPEAEQELRLRLFKLIPEDRLPQPLIKVWTAYDEARKACDEARKALNSKLIKLHKELCPDCPFNGKTIFTAKEK